MGKGRGTCSGQGRLESSDKLPRCFSGLTHRSQQPEWGCSLLCPTPLRMCLRMCWLAWGWPWGAFKTPTLTVSASKTEMHLVPCEWEGKEGTVHTVCRRERRRVCGEAKTTQSGLTSYLSRLWDKMTYFGLWFQVMQPITVGTSDSWPPRVCSWASVVIWRDSDI